MIKYAYNVIIYQIHKIKMFCLLLLWRSFCFESKIKIFNMVMNWWKELMTLFNLHVLSHFSLKPYDKIFSCYFYICSWWCEKMKVKDIRIFFFAFFYKTTPIIKLKILIYQVLACAFILFFYIFLVFLSDVIRIGIIW